jgi:hypothetical protein
MLQPAAIDKTMSHWTLFHKTYLFDIYPAIMRASPSDRAEFGLP